MFIYNNKSTCLTTLKLPQMKKITKCLQAQHFYQPEYFRLIKINLFKQEQL